MDYAELFLEHADALKYQMYTVLARPYVQDVSVSDLATQLKSKYQPVYNVFQELLADMVTITGDRRERVRARLLAATDLPLSLDAYRAYLAQRNLLYRLVDTVLQTGSTTCQQFCDQEYISRSTLARKLKRLNRALSDYHLRFRLARFDFVGNELNVRYFVYSMYWWVYRGTTWVFSALSQARLRREVAAISVVEDRPVEDRQQLYFLAISHLRAAKGLHPRQAPPIAQFAAAVTQHCGARQAWATQLDWTDTAAFQFFQLSQPRFDAPWRDRRLVAQEAAVLATALVVPVDAALHQALAETQWETDLSLNLLRLLCGFVLVGGPFPQAQDFIGGLVPPEAAVSPAVAAVCARLPERPEYIGFRRDLAPFTKLVARLVAPADADRLQVRLAVDPQAAGYQRLVDFVACVPWLATVTDREADLLIAAGDAPADVTWYAEAVSLAAYRDSLVRTLVAKHAQKISGQTKGQ